MLRAWGIVTPNRGLLIHQCKLLFRTSLSSVPVSAVFTMDVDLRLHMQFLPFSMLKQEESACTISWCTRIKDMNGLACQVLLRFCIAVHSAVHLQVCIMHPPLFLEWGMMQDTG